MSARLWIIIAAGPFLAAWGDRGPRWPHVGPMPDDPGVSAPSRYESITAGTKGYRPVAPLPWGDINCRVAPPGALEPKPVPKDGKAPQQPTPQHKH